MLNTWKFSSFAPTLSDEQVKEMADKVESSWSNAKSSCWQGGCHFGFENVARDGIYRQAGYAFDLRPCLKKWLVKDSEGRIEQYYAPNKTSLRTSGRVRKGDKIAICPENF